jgi:hypothetical protein
MSSWVKDEIMEYPIGHEWNHLYSTLIDTFGGGDHHIHLI